MIYRDIYIYRNTYIYIYIRISESQKLTVDAPSPELTNSQKDGHRYSVHSRGLKTACRLSLLLKTHLFHLSISRFSVGAYGGVVFWSLPYKGRERERDAQTQNAAHVRGRSPVVGYVNTP